MTVARVSLRGKSNFYLIKYLFTRKEGRKTRLSELLTEHVISH